MYVQLRQKLSLSFARIFMRTRKFCVEAGFAEISQIIVVVVAHIYPSVTGKRQTLNIG